MLFHQTLIVSCAPARAIGACEEYLRRKHASVETTGDLSIRAHGPLVLLSADRRLYSRENFIGVNPLVLAGTIHVDAEEFGTGTALRIRLSPALHVFVFLFVLLYATPILYLSAAPIPAWIFVMCALAGYVGSVIWLLSAGIESELRTSIENQT